MQPDQQQRIMGYFIEEAKDHLNTIEQGLLKLQATIQDPEMANEVFRAAHSIKGGAAMLGLGSIQKVSHRLEDFFKLLKETPITIDQKLENLFLRTFDALQELVGQLQGPFGLTEEAGNNIIAGVEPTFDELEQHLTALAGLADGLADGVTQSVGVTAEQTFSGATLPDPTLEQIFRNDVPVQLRDMLRLFKKAETDDEGRQQLQEYCRSLAKFGEHYGLSNWCALLETARRAIAHPSNSYRSLAPIIIKDIKQGQELVLAGQARNITACAQLQALADLYEPLVPDNFDDLDDLLVDSSLSGFDEPSINEPSIFDDQSVFGDQLVADSLDLDLSFEGFQPAASGELDFSSNFDDQIFNQLPEHQNGPEVGTAELNSLADLFEGEVPDLGLTWQEEEVLADTSDLLSSNYGLENLDASVDFSDLLFEEVVSEPPAPISDDDLDALFGEDLEDESTHNVEAEPRASDLNSQYVNPQTDADEFEDLLQIQSSEPAAIPPADFLNLDSSFADLELEEVAHPGIQDPSESFNQTEEFDNLDDLFGGLSLDELSPDGLSPAEFGDRPPETTTPISEVVPDPWGELNQPASVAPDLGELPLDGNSVSLENFDIPDDLDFGDSLNLPLAEPIAETSPLNELLELDQPHSLHEPDSEIASQEFVPGAGTETSSSIPDPWGETGSTESLSLEDLSLDALDLSDLLSESGSMTGDAPEQDFAEFTLDSPSESTLNLASDESSLPESNLFESNLSEEDGFEEDGFEEDGFDVDALDELFGDASSADSSDDWFDTVRSPEQISEAPIFEENNVGASLPQDSVEETAIADLLSSPLQEESDDELDFLSSGNLDLSNFDTASADDFSLNFSSDSTSAAPVDDTGDLDDLFGESISPMFDFSASSTPGSDAITAFGEEEDAIDFDQDLLGGEDEFSLDDVSQTNIDSSASDSLSDLDDLFEDDPNAPSSGSLEGLDDLSSGGTLPSFQENSEDFGDFLSQGFSSSTQEQDSGAIDLFSNEPINEEAFDHNEGLAALDDLLGVNPVPSETHHFETIDFSSDPELFSPVETGEESLAPDELNDFNDLDELLSDDLAGADSPEFFTAVSPSTQREDASFNTEIGLEDFSDLEALLDEETTEPLAAEPLSNEQFSASPTVESSLFSTGDSEFDDLDDLLKDAEEKMGGSPSVSVGRGVAPQARRTPRPGKVFSEQTMRVPVKHLDNLSNLVGELVVNRNSLEQDQERLRQSLDNLLYQVQQLSDVGQRMQDLYERSLLESSLLASRQANRSNSLPLGSGRKVTAVEVNNIGGVEYDPLEMDRFTGFHSLSQEMIELIVRVRESSSDIEFIVDETEQVTRMFRQVTTQLQEGLTRSRMVPFAQTADRLPRAVRDISMKVGKQAELIIEGRETLIDKMILEQLYDPMTHLVNNAITHGIESPEVRRAAGKPAAGRIVIRAFHQGNQTIISVSDDGAGIDIERVKMKAIEKGLLTSEESHSMSRLDVYDILFHPGFTTKDQADDYSGRGVGMDVVRTSLSEIRGVINTDSNAHKGTTFTIRLPLTLSISKALCCISDRARIAFPMDGVEDMIDIPKDRIQTNAEGQPCIAWRDTVLPLRPLSELLAYNRYLSRGNVYGGNQEDDIVSIVVLRSAGNFLALQVDQVLGEQEIVIKQLEGPVPKPLGVAGATVLGDGRIMPIADVLELIDLSMGRIRRDSGVSLWEQSGSPTDQEPEIAKTEPMVLIVDDSITVRELLSMTFNKVGYRVEQARDGQEAWEKLRSGLPCDIVFCDIEMPRMDGLELLSRIQKDPHLQHLPIAMLTSRGADRHRQMASSLGASGYFTKPYLEEALLDAAQRMLKGERLLGASG